MDVCQIKTFKNADIDGPVMIDFPIGHELKFGNGFLSNISIDALRVNEDIRLISLCFFYKSGRFSCFTFVDREYDRFYNEIQNSDDNKEAIIPLQIVAGILFLEHNPDLFSPVILKKDMDKYENADEFERAKYVEKAHRNGLFGYEIGRDIPTKDELAKMRKENAEAIKKGQKCPHLICGHFCPFFMASAFSFRIFANSSLVGMSRPIS